MLSRTAKYYPFVIQLAISLLALVYVFYKVLLFHDWSFFFGQLLINRWGFLLILLLQFVLSAINLSIEAVKWQMLTSVLDAQKFSNAFRQIIRGVQLGMLTPARAGEPLGKALLFTKGKRTQALLLSAAGSMMQNIVIVFTGIVSSLFLFNYGMLDSSMFFSIQKGILQYGFLIPLFGLFVVLGLYRLLKFVWVNPIIKRISFHLQIYRKLGYDLICKLFIVTFLRFLVFSFQLWLVLDFFEIFLLPVQYWLVPLYFTIITFIPTIALADLGIRTSIALFVFGIASTNTIAIITSVFVIWLFNLALPSLMGIFLLRGKKLIGY